MASNSRSSSTSPSRSKSPHKKQDDDNKTLPRDQRNALRTYFKNKEDLEYSFDEELNGKIEALKVRNSKNKEALLGTLTERDTNAIALTDLKSQAGKLMYLRLNVRNTVNNNHIPDNVSPAVSSILAKDVISLYNGRTNQIQKSTTKKAKVVAKRRRTIKPQTVGTHREPSPIRMIKDNFFDDDGDEEQEDHDVVSRDDKAVRRSPSPASKQVSSDQEPSSKKEQDSSKKRTRAPKKELSEDDIKTIQCFSDAISLKICELSKETKVSPVINDVKPRKCDDKAPPELVNIAKEFLEDKQLSKKYSAQKKSLTKAYNDNISKAKDDLMGYMKKEELKKVYFNIKFEDQNNEESGSGNVTINYLNIEKEAKIDSKAIGVIVRKAVESMFKNNDTIPKSVNTSSGMEFINKLLDPSSQRANNFRRDLIANIYKIMDEWKVKNATISEKIEIVKKEETIIRQDDEESYKAPLPSFTGKQPQKSASSSSSTPSKTTNSPSVPKKVTIVSNSNNLKSQTESLKARLTSRIGKK